MNKIRFANKKNILFVGYLLAFFIISAFVFKPENVYSGMAYESVDVDIKVDVSKDSGDDYDNKIVIEAMKNTSPMPANGSLNDGKMTLDIKDNTSGEFKIAFDEPGEYEYKVYEVKGKNKNIEYDTKVYHVTVYVMDNNGKLEYALSLKVEGVNSKPDKIQFVNIEEEETTQEEKTKKETEETEEETTEDTTKDNGDDVVNDENRDNPQTGDEFPLDTVLLIMFTSCALIVSLVIIKMRLEKNEEDDERENEESNTEEEDSSEGK